MNGEGTRIGALRYTRPAVQTGFDVVEGAFVTSQLYFIGSLDDFCPPPPPT